MRTLGRRWVTAAIVVVAAAAGGWPASAQQVAISVDLHDYAGNSQTVLRDTLRNLSDILRNAGVQVVSEGAPRYTINIVPAEIALQLKQPADGMGFAVVGEGAHLAYVLMHASVAPSARARQVRPTSWRQ